LFLHHVRKDNALSLVNDAATPWLGPGTPESASVPKDSKVRVYCARTTATRSGDEVQVTWVLSFKAAYVGIQNLYLHVKDQAGLTEGNVNKGTRTITGPNQAPHVGTVSPTGDSSAVGELGELYHVLDGVGLVIVDMGFSAGGAA